MTSIRQEMPVLVRHEGDWVGTYIVVDTQGNVLDRYKSHLTCEFPTDSPYPYYQTNRYTWNDGKHQEYAFPGIYRHKVLWFDTDRIDGKAWEVDENTIVLYFTYKGVANMSLYEMIQISPCNNYRTRTWHWFKDSQLDKRTLIQEHRLQKHS